MLNHICVMGRLTRDPELRTTQSGVSVTSFTLAVDRDYAANGAERETDFIDCVAWRSTAEFVAKYFVKGQMAVASGRLVSRKWQDRNGNNRTNWEVLADNVYFGEPKRQDSGGAYSGQTGGSYGSYTPPPRAAAPSQQTTFTELPDEDDGELPF